MYAVAYRNLSGLLAMKTLHLTVSGEKHLATVTTHKSHNYLVVVVTVVLYVRVGLYCELSSLLDNSETFVTFCKRKVAYRYRKTSVIAGHAVNYLHYAWS